MTLFFQWIAEHHGTAAIAGYWLFSALVSGMPVPTTASGIGYVWLYQSLHFLASNLQSVFAKKTLTEEATHVTPTEEKKL